MNKEEKLVEYLRRSSPFALAFSGGVDSCYLLYAAKLSGADVRAYYVKSDFQPEFEFADAKEFAREQAVQLSVLNLDILCDERIALNPFNRCYYCKRSIMGAIISAAKSEGISLVADGTNASDDINDRPGMKALRELGVVSPLRECTLSKSEIRRLSKEAGLKSFDKPAYACLATRIEQDKRLTAELLKGVEAAEECLMAMGFRDFRVRVSESLPRLELTQSDMAKAQSMRGRIIECLRQSLGADDFIIKGRQSNE